MKITLPFLLLLICSAFCSAQTSVLPVDERGKFIYYELVGTKGIAKITLIENIIGYFKNQSKDLKLKSSLGDTVFVANGKIIINKTVLVMSHPSGEILFNFQAELKDEKYRFWLTDFNFIPYQRDRYGNFVASTNKETPLEGSPGKLNAAQWKEYQVQAKEYAQDFAIKFKNAMASQVTATTPVSEKRVVKKDW
jgi:hypothetical protein